MKYFVLILITLSSLFATEAFIDSTKLKTILNDSKTIVMDVSKKANYNIGHIDGALHVNVLDYINNPINVNPENIKEFKGFYLSPNIENKLKLLGIKDDSNVVIYSHNTKEGVLNSSFLAMILIASGFENVSILNGGYLEWVFKNQMLVSSKNIQQIPNGNISVKSNDIFVDSAYVKSAIGKIKILDARSSDEYYGIKKSKKIQGFGHIPSASNSFYKHKFYSDCTIKDRQKLDMLYFKGHELNLEDEIIVYADDIFTASMEWYILYQHMGFRNTKIYKNSLLEWVNKESNELVRFKWE
jgi:thiosulfate/3-mercaptopyruvate sulfurtransferase